MINISKINVRSLEAGELKQILPELYELNSVVENNPWHDHDSVFSHTLKVLKQLEKLLKHADKKVSGYLSLKIDGNTRRQILFLATAFHDIAKPETFEEKDGVTNCPYHEEVGVKKVGPILDRFDLSEKEKINIKKIIKYHGQIHGILSLEKDQLEIQLNEFRKKCTDIFIEQILLAMADTAGSQLNELIPDEFSFRINYYQQILDEIYL